MKRSTKGRSSGDSISAGTLAGITPGLALVLAVVVAYLPVWNAGFVWDDHLLITGNPDLQTLGGLWNIWTSSAADVCPLTTTTFWIEHALWGFAPRPFHLVTLLLHAACALMLWRVLLDLRVPGAWLGAALWALHPVQVESVAWVSEMKNTQSGLFFLLATHFFVKWLRAADGRGCYVLALLFAALAMASKSSTVILPAVFCLVAWRVEGRWTWRNLARVAPFFILTLAASALSIWTQGLSMAEVADPALVRSGPERLVTAGIAVWFYLGKLAWPFPLMTVYPRWNIDASMGSSYLPLLAVALALVVLWLKPEPWARALFFVSAFFLGALLPVLGLFDNAIFIYSLVFDHFQYLASMGPLALAGAVLVRLGQAVLPGRMGLRTGLGVVLLLGLGILSWQRARDFKSEETLWADTVAKNPASWIAHYNLAVELAKQGRKDEAKRNYQRTLALYPIYANAHVNLGMLLLDEGRADEAMAEIDAALEDDPKSGEAQNALGWALLKKGRVDDATAAFKRATEISPQLEKAAFNYGQILLQRGKTDLAIAEFRRALDLDPTLAEAHYFLGLALMKEGLTDPAIAEFQAGLRIDPNNVDAYNNLGLALVQKGQLNDGVIQYQKALEIDPKAGAVESNLGVALFQAGLKDEAMKHARRGLELDPGSVRVNDNLGNVLLAAGQVDDAIAQFHKTIQLDPNFGDAHRNLGLALLMKGQASEALVQLQEALRLDPNDRVAPGLLEKAQAAARPKPAVTPSPGGFRGR